MGQLTYEDLKFIYRDHEKTEILLNCGDYLSNKSRLSMHRLEGADYLTIPELLVGLLKREQEKNGNLDFPAMLIDVLLASRLTKQAHPVKVLEYGSEKGRLSWHLAEVVGAFHDQSSLVCAYDTIEPQWMEHISETGHMPKLSFYAGDFGEFQLQENHFDIIFINGIVNFMHPEKIILDALRLAAKNCFLLCYCEDTPLMESTFKLYFEKRAEYEIEPSRKILTAYTGDACWGEMGLSF